jgi:L-2,4-diaminobutyrate decarboxylase
MRRALLREGAALYFSPMPRVPLSPLSDALREAYSPSRFQSDGQQVLATVADHLKRAQKRSRPSSYPAPPPEAERAYWENPQHQPDSLHALHERVIERSNHLHDPRYMGHQVAPVLPVSALNGMVTDVLNNGQAIYEMGPSNAVHEELLMAELGRALGLPQGCGGILCHGGTLGNLVALMAAQRRVALGLGVDSWRDGIRAFPQPLVVLVSERAHYCIDRAMRILGWGASGTVLVKSDRNHRMDVEDLRIQLDLCASRGQQVLAVVGSSCTTSAGAFDPLEAVADACEARGVWLHVDGAHGAAVAFSQTHRHLIGGIERAQSVVMDFHKVCGLPALCTGVFYRHHADSFLPFSQHAEYLWDNANDLDWWDTGKRTLECTKRMLSTRLAAIRAEYGWGIWGEMVDRMWELGQVLAGMLEDRENWELAMAPQANIVCFRPTPQGQLDDVAWNRIVKALRKRHLAEGSGYVVQTEFDGVVWLRCTLMNPLTEEKDLVQMLDEFESLLPSVMENVAGS